MTQRVARGEQAPTTGREWISPTTGRRYGTTKYHYFGVNLVICPACNCGPCAPDCAEQAIPDPKVERPPVISGKAS